MKPREPKEPKFVILTIDVLSSPGHGHRSIIRVSDPSSQNEQLELSLDKHVAGPARIGKTLAAKTPRLQKLNETWFPMNKSPIKKNNRESLFKCPKSLQSNP